MTPAEFKDIHLAQMRLELARVRTGMIENSQTYIASLQEQLTALEQEAPLTAYLKAALTAEELAKEAMEMWLAVFLLHGKMEMIIKMDEKLAD